MRNFRVFDRPIFNLQFSERTPDEPAEDLDFVERSLSDVSFELGVPDTGSIDFSDGIPGNGAFPARFGLIDSVLSIDLLPVRDRIPLRQSDVETPVASPRAAATSVQLTGAETLNLTTSATTEPGQLVSDDFADGSLAAVWSIEGPSEASVAFATAGPEAYLELISPDGSYDIWDSNGSVRVMQAVDDGDFQIETRFLSTPTEKFQMQGLLIEQDENNWIRLDTYSDGKNLYAFGAITTDGASSSQFKVAITGGVAPYLRVTREGDVWTLEYSVDGATYVTAGSFSYDLTVSEVGVFAANTGRSPGFTAQVDYFVNTANPLAEEDGTIVVANAAPVASDDALVTTAGSALLITVATDLLDNDSDADGDAISVTGFTAPEHGTLIDNEDGTWSYTPDTGYSGTDSFAYTVTDGTDTDTATVALTVNAVGEENIAPSAADDALEATANTGFLIAVATDLLANDSDVNGDALSVTGFTQPANGTLVDNGDGTWSYTPNEDYTGGDSFTYTVTDGELTDTATVTLTVNAETAPSALVSDDFAGGSLGAAWVIEGPSEATARLGTSGSEAYLELVSPDGAYNIWDSNGSVRAMQATEDGDFQIETRFLSTPTEKFQMQGLLVEQDENNWIRMDTYSDGANLYVFGAVTIDGESSSAFKVAIPGGVAPYLRLTREGDVWTLEYSVDGATYVTAGSFSHDMTVSQVGVFAANTGQAPGFTAQVDYFVNTADPLAEEDGTIVSVNAAPVASDDSLATAAGAALLITVATDLLGNDNDSDGDPLSVTGFTQPENGTLVDNEDGTWSYTPVDGFSGTDSFTYTVSDGELTDTATVTVIVAGGNTAPEAADDTLATTENTALLIAIATDLLSNDSDAEGDTLSVTGFTLPENGTVVDNGDGTWTYTPDTGFSGTDSFTYTVTDGEFTDTATVDIAVGNPIDVWYGEQQTFGSPGNAQQWINILGSVGGDVVSLTYSLNGGDERELSIGPDGRRLESDGDFNIDLAYSELDGTSGDDVITITATMSNGDTYTSDVTVHYQAGNVWNPNYSIDWATVDNIQDVVQVADGLWTWDENGAHVVDTGYDRMLVLGDQSWDNYQLDIKVTMNDLTNESMGIGFLWNGHTDDPIANKQPNAGWNPGAAFFYKYNTKKLKSHSYHDWSDLLGTVGGIKLEEGHTFNFQIRVEQIGIYDRQYSIKIWEDGFDEPSQWTLQTIETFSLDEAPATGSIYLDLHHYDVTFGDLTVTEITGNDIIQGNDTAEIQVAADTSSSNPGQGEIDVFVGAGGADLFVFGDENGTYYDDGVAVSSGEEDYGFVWDYVAGTDQIQLAGSAASYVLTTDAPGLTAGTAIWLKGQDGDADELIGVLNGIYGLDLDGTDFVYVTTLVA
ncbi:hypothetical protein LA6_000025 [Marinibacterium anthonyi]|nr:hypothetical protein LA6_000025 [Marinibacterium anthonyi]